MGKVSEAGWSLLFKAAIPVDYAINNFKKVSASFAVASLGWVGFGMAQKYDGLNSLELQLSAQGKSEAVARCLTDATSRKYPWTTTVFNLHVADSMIKNGHELAASGTVTECKPKLN